MRLGFAGSKATAQARVPSASVHWRQVPPLLVVMPTPK
jgi:hypothetical protein